MIGSSSPVSPARWPRNRLPLVARGSGASSPRRRRRAAARCGSSSASPSSDVGDQAGDVVGAAGLEAGPDELDRREVRADPLDRMSASRPSSSTPLAPSLHSSSRSPGVSSSRNRSGSRSWMPSMALRIRLRCGWTASLLLGDPALVDQRLHERVVAGELADLAVAEQVGAAVAHVPHRDAVAVEERDRGGGAGAVERRLLVDQLGDPLVGTAQRVGDQARAGPRRPGRRLVEPAQLRDRGARGDVAPGRAADAVADGDAGAGRRTRSPGCPCGRGPRRRSRRSRDAPAVTSAARGSSCRCGPGCRG